MSVCFGFRLSHDKDNFAFGDYGFGIYQPNIGRQYFSGIEDGKTNKKLIDLRAERAKVTEKTPEDDIKK